MVTTGSVYQRRKDGRWVACLSVNGKRIARYATSEREARQLLAALQRDVGLGTLQLPQSITLAEWVERWLAATPHKPSTRATHVRTLQPFLEALGRKRLDRLTPLVLQTTLTRLQKRVAPRPLAQGWAALRACLTAAVRLRLIAVNPCAAVRPPRWEPQTRRLWTIDEYRRFVAAALADDGHYSPAFVLAAVCGLRCGELLGLRWSDVDLTAGTLSVRQSIVWVENRPVVGTPKSRASERVIALPGPARQALARLPRALDADTAIVRTTTGTIPTQGNLRRALHTLCLKAGVPPVRLHDLRHAAALAALAATHGDLHAVQRLLGHHDVTTTLRIYGSSWHDATRVAASLDALFGQGDSSAVLG